MPHSNENKRIAILTTVRNDTIFLDKWIDYYAQQFGTKNLFVLLDGHDQPVPQSAENTNIISLPHIPLNRAKGDKRRAKIMSDFARGLFELFDIVIVTDVDEFIIVDPKLNLTLAQYLSRKSGYSTLSALGLDVAQHLEQESPIDLSKPFLSQRRYAHLSARYTKPSIAFQPVRWGSWMHRIKGRNFRIDPNLYLIHLGMVDYQLSTGKTHDKDRLSAGWAGHLARREEAFKIVTGSAPVDGDKIFAGARRIQSLRRPIYALNKPGTLKNKPVVILPQRFETII